MTLPTLVERIRFFASSPTTLQPEDQIRFTRHLATYSEKIGFSGILLFTSNDNPLEPWVLSQNIIQNTNNISTFIAVNPIYMHPFTTAKFVSSIAQIYKRKVCLNMIVGTSIRDRENLGDNIEHDQRYERLAEFIEILQKILRSSKVFSFDGNYYKLNNIRISPEFPPDLFPDFLIAGQSEAAKRVAKQTNSMTMRMLSPELHLDKSQAEGVNFGLIARPTKTAAIEAAEMLFPEDADGEMFQKITMRNTDAIWKRRLHALGASAVNYLDPSNGYWLRPFMTFRSDCPFFVGSYDEISNMIVSLSNSGVKVVILDVLPSDTELDHLNKCLNYRSNN